MSMPSATSPAHPSPLFILPPPLYFGVSFGAAMLVHHFVPLAFPELPYLHLVALVVLVVAAIGIPCQAITFLVRRTTLNPFAAPTALLEKGLYRLSRNPMYVSLAIIYLAGMIVAGSVWPLALLPIPLLIMDRVVIPFEEANMRLTFGGTFDAYCARVRRWI